jgi:hypothetical protein
MLRKRHEHEDIVTEGDVAIDIEGMGRDPDVKDVNTGPDGGPDPTAGPDGEAGPTHGHLGEDMGPTAGSHEGSGPEPLAGP